MKCGNKVSLGKKAFISTSGCAPLHKEAQLFEDYFIRNGWSMVTSPAKADFILLNLCSLNAERKHANLNYVKEVKKARAAGALLAVTGCISTIASSELRELAVDAQIQIKNIDELDKLLGSQIPLSRIEEPHVVRVDPILTQLGVLLRNDFLKKVSEVLRDPVSFLGVLYALNIPEEHRLRGAYCVTIGEGCLNQCSYCAIRFARGILRSVPVETILQQVEKGIKAGHRKIHLLATNPAQYGLDLPGSVDFCDLLQRIIRLPGKLKLVIPDMDPDYFVKNFTRLKDILKSRKFLEITFAAQSGSPTVLERMNRNYNVEAFKQCVRELRAMDPGIKLNGHVMVGFPGETEAEFGETFRLLKEVRFNKALVFGYGDLPGVESAKFPGHLESRIIRKRIQRIHRYLILRF